MKQIWKGQLKLRIAKECPYYGTAGRHLHKVLFYKWGISVSLWIYYEDNPSGELSDWAIAKLKKIFPDCEIERGRYVRWNGHTYYPEDCGWLFCDKYEWEGTKDWQVMFDKKSKRYFGYSHRAVQGFGIGDMLFCLSGKIGEDKKENKKEYYMSKKYRRKYILTLLRYHIKNDWMAFEDLCEDEIIGHGISSIIPFRERGRKRIETLDEAFEAARNFAHYVS